jgi:hypothetical protein
LLIIPYMHSLGCLDGYAYVQYVCNI